MPQKPWYLCFFKPLIYRDKYMEFITAVRSRTLRKRCLNLSFWKVEEPWMSLVFFCFFFPGIRLLKTLSCSGSFYRGNITRLTRPSLCSLILSTSVIKSAFYTHWRSAAAWRRFRVPTSSFSCFWTLWGNSFCTKCTSSLVELKFFFSVFKTT